jgi:hypothetical protein
MGDQQSPINYEWPKELDDLKGNLDEVQMIGYI